ncbi:hypothetical protein E9232_007007 [Inquilinus ginsengisoli]|uniref:Uncharacterized protein n=2 Tax=Inquilinus ginsengisoli TaxID=363840 RepID=A0ABU1K0Q8_9PROT|nr:hypothetical protein [Inquilinus ginsengisoli]
MTLGIAAIRCGANGGRVGEGMVPAPRVAAPGPQWPVRSKLDMALGSRKRSIAPGLTAGLGGPDLLGRYKEGRFELYHDYRDIRSLTKQSPKWFDEKRVPRYCDFHPNMAANIYAKQAALVLISCQSCDSVFSVCITGITNTESQRLGKSLADELQDGTLDYGDPPNIGCCSPGPSMTSVPRRILQYWVLDPKKWQWYRDETIEGPYVPELREEWQRQMYRDLADQDDDARASREDEWQPRTHRDETDEPDEGDVVLVPYKEWQRRELAKQRGVWAAFRRLLDRLKS